MSETVGLDGITTRDTAARYPIPIVTSRIGLTADAAACARINSPPTSEISGRRARRGVPAGCKGVLARTGPGAAALQASYRRTPALATGQGEVAAPASFPRTRARTGPREDGHPVRSVRPTGLLQEASGADGTDPKRPQATGEVHSAEVALHRAASSATEELAAWAAAVASEGGAVVAAVAAVGAGVEPFPRVSETSRSRTMPNRSLLLNLILPVAATVLLASNTHDGQLTFATPRQAARALLVAAEADDVPALTRIFGPESDEILNSGDPVQDRNTRAQFVKRATRLLRARIVAANPNQAVLLIGTDGFPFPIPLVRRAGRWHFDTAAGKSEILARRIGSNELEAITACKAYVEAQYDYASEDRNKNGIPEYARKLISSPGKRDGLFWPESDSPPTQLAEKVKSAQAEGYRSRADTRVPYHGYYYRILLAQGPKARGGALEYVQHGSMIGGFGLVAWPADYRVSGVKTFIVNQDGVIYEKDLGSSTSTTVDSITAFDPDGTWHRVR